MSRCTLRYIFTVLLYAGVAVFLFPYITGHLGDAVFFLVAGIGLAVVSGILRCCYTEGDCPDRVPPPPGTGASTTHPANR